MKSKGLWVASLAVLLAVSTVGFGAGGTGGPAKEVAKAPAKEAFKVPAKEAAKEPVKVAALEPAKAASKEPYKIGVSMSLTGPAGNFGEAGKRGVDLAVEVINAKGGINGHPLQVIMYDDETKPDLGLENAKKLIQKDNVIMLTGYISFIPTGAAAPEIQRAKVPVQVMTAAYEIDPAKESYIFSVTYSTETQVNAQLAYAKKKGWTKLASFISDDAMGEWITKTYAKSGPKEGISVLGVERTKATEKDLTGQMAKLRAMNPQVIHAYLSGATGALAIKAAEQLGMNVPIFTSGANQNEAFAKLVKDAKSDILVASAKLSVYDQIPNTDPLKPFMKEFYDAFVAKYKTPPTYINADGWDAIQLSAAALKVAGTDREKIRTYLENVKNFRTAGGVISRSPQNHFGYHPEELVIAKLKDGKWVVAD